MKFNIVPILAAAAGGLLLAGALASAAQPHDAKLAPRGAASAAATVGNKAQPRIEPVDINNASKAELMKLPGLTAADAQGVIAARPYRSKAQLVTRKVITESQYQAIKSSILARQPGVPKPRMAGRT